MTKTLIELFRIQQVQESDCNYAIFITVLKTAWHMNDLSVRKTYYRRRCMMGVVMNIRHS